MTHMTTTKAVVAHIERAMPVMTSETAASWTAARTAATTMCRPCPSCPIAATAAASTVITTRAPTSSGPAFSTVEDIAQSISAGRTSRDRLPSLWRRAVGRACGANRGTGRRRR
jgi:hypothetical protein